jgi:inorganic pyrophosphatase
MHDYRDNPDPEPSGAQWARDEADADRKVQAIFQKETDVQLNVERLTDIATRLVEQKYQLRQALLAIKVASFGSYMDREPEAVEVWRLADAALEENK